MTLTEAGRKGGLARARNLSHDEIVRIGKLGGGQRLPTITELIESQNKKEGGNVAGPGKTYKSLLRFYLNTQEEE
jgi:hypothetical protein